MTDNMDLNDGNESMEVSNAKDICDQLRTLIDHEKSEGNVEDAAKLQQAYDLCEEVIGEEKSEDSSKLPVSSMAKDELKGYLNQEAMKRQANQVQP